MKSLIDMGEWIILGPLMNGGCRRLVVWLDEGRNLSASVKDEMNLDPVTVRLLKAAQGARCPLQWPGPTLNKAQRLRFSGGSATLILGGGITCAQTAARAVASLRSWGGWDSRGRLLLVAGVEEEEETLEVEVQKAAQALWKELAADALILVQTQDSPRLFSFNPFRPTHHSSLNHRLRSFGLRNSTNSPRANSSRPSRLSKSSFQLKEVTARANRKSNKGLYDNKVENVNGYEIKVSIFNAFPTAVYAEKSRYDGPDGKTMELILSHINAIPVIVDPGPSSYGRRLSNGTLIGSSGDIAHRRADVAFNSRLLKMDRLGDIDYLYPHIQSNVRILVPNSEKIPQYENLILPFHPQTWLCIIMCVPFASMCYYITNRLSLLATENSPKMVLVNVVFDSFSTMIAISSPSQPKPNADRIFWIFWVWYSLLITTVFQGAFTSYLAIIIYSNPIDTLEELYKANFKIHMHPGIVEILRQKNVKDKLTPFYGRFRESTSISTNLKDTNTIAFHRNLSAVITERVMKFQTQNRQFQDEDGRSRLHVMKERPLSVYQQYEIGVQSPFSSRFNTILFRVAAAGLTDKWYGDAYYEQVTKGRLVREPPKDAKAPPRSIQISHLQGVFMLLGTGAVGSAVVLLVEILKSRRERVKSQRWSENLRQ